MLGRLSGHRYLPVGAIIWVMVAVAPSVHASTIGFSSYRSWQWGGFSGSGLPAQSQYWWNTTGRASLGYSPPTTTSSPSPSPASLLPVSLSGYVFLDVDPDDGSMNMSDWWIPDATVALFLDTDPASPLMTTKTNAEGFYFFEDLLPDVYTISLVTHSYDGRPSAGSLGGTVDEDNHRITAISTKAGDTGTGYNFAEWGYPIDLVSKRLTPPLHVSEPNSFVLLVAGGLFLATVRTIRRRRRSKQLGV